MSLHTGDDLGYMFTDTTLHGGDGERVTCLWQCFSTQAEHYVTTNGRFIVHTAVMALLNLMPLWLFRVLNALVFATLWLLCRRLTDRRSATVAAAALLLLLTCLPTPAMLLFTLVAFAVNYLWVALAVTAFLLLWRRGAPGWLIVTAAFIMCTLQESFSLPLCAGLLVLCCLRRAPWRIFAALVAGTAVCVFAPGNFSHAQQGGGFAPEAILSKTLALLRDLPWTVIFWGFLAWAVCLVANRRRAVRFASRHIFSFTVVAASLLLACATYTSPRQLTCPCLFVILMALDALSGARTHKYTPAALTMLSAAFLCLVAWMRMPVAERWHQVERAAASGAAVAYPENAGQMPGQECRITYLNRALNPDPLINRGLVAVGDRYTINALRRLHTAHAQETQLTTILPYDPDSIAAAAGGGRIGPFTVDNETRGARATFKHAGTVYALHYSPL